MCSCVQCNDGTNGPRGQTELPPESGCRTHQDLSQSAGVLVLFLWQVAESRCALVIYKWETTHRVYISLLL